MDIFMFTTKICFILSEKQKMFANSIFIILKAYSAIKFSNITVQIWN